MSLVHEARIVYHRSGPSSRFTATKGRAERGGRPFYGTMSSGPISRRKLAISLSSAVHVRR